MCQLFQDNTIIKETDSTSYSIYTTNYYYSNYGDVNIIRQNNKYDFFRHTYKKFKPKFRNRKKRVF